MELNDIISSGLLELYVMGIASEEEVRDVKKWAAQYPEVAAEIAAIEKGMESYAQANGIEPDETVKEKIMAGIGGSTNAVQNTGIVKDLPTEPEVKVRNINSNWKWVAAASIVLLIGSAVMNMNYYSKYNTASKDLDETKALLAQEQAEGNSMKHEINDIVKNPNSVPVGLKEMDPAMNAKAKIFWMQNTGEVMIDASTLPDAPSGMQYQFWAIVNGKPVDGGMIITNDKGMKFKMQPMKSFGKAEAFAISLEKAGGNPTPTHVVSMGKTI